MYSIKIEAEQALCQGCLTADRKLTPLTNYEMYFAILENKLTLEEYKYLNILLCWECQALLRRAQRFRDTVLRAQYLLSVTHVEQISPNTLSTLNYICKQNYDCVIEETIDNNHDPEIVIDDKDVFIKEESQDNFGTDNFDSYSDNLKEKITKSVSKKKVYKKDRERRELKKIDNKLDLNNPDKYFSEVCLSEREVEEILERERREGESRPHACNVCGFWYGNNKELIDHKKVFINSDKQLFKQHEVQLHTKYVCDQCNYSTHTKNRLEKHVVLPCPECGKVFSRKNYMNNHIKLFHSNESRHHCPLCDKYFVNGWGLRSHHKFVHQKIPMPKNKICSVCGRGFGTNRVLENHMRTHTGERPFACAHCAAAFAQRVALRAHLVAIHKQK